MQSSDRDLTAPDTPLQQQAAAPAKPPTLRAPQRSMASVQSMDEPVTQSSERDLTAPDMPVQRQQAAEPAKAPTLRAAQRSMASVQSMDEPSTSRSAFAEQLCGWLRPHLTMLICLQGRVHAPRANPVSQAAGPDEAHLQTSSAHAAHLQQRVLAAGVHTIWQPQACPHLHKTGTQIRNLTAVICRDQSGGAGAHRDLTAPDTPTYAQSSPRPPTMRSGASMSSMDRCADTAPSLMHAHSAPQVVSAA